MPFRMDGIEGAPEEGKDDSEACRLKGLLLALLVVWLVEGRYDETAAMSVDCNVNDAQMGISTYEGYIRAVLTCLLISTYSGREHRQSVEQTKHRVLGKRH